jgi:hypothetical protein
MDPWQHADLIVAPQRCNKSIPYLRRHARRVLIVVDAEGE